MRHITVRRLLRHRDVRNHRLRKRIYECRRCALFRDGRLPQSRSRKSSRALFRDTLDAAGEASRAEVLAPLGIAARNRLDLKSELS